MATRSAIRDFTPVLDAARHWAERCLVDDKSVLADEVLWALDSVTEVRIAFVEHPDQGDGDFMTKLRGQLKDVSPQAKRLAAEMLWALLLFPSNIKAATKRQHVIALWSLSGQDLPPGNPMLSDQVLAGIGSGGPGFNNHRWRELAFMITLVEDLKRRPRPERSSILGDYDAFTAWIEQAPQEGHRQFRHMLRYLTFPKSVERMSSNRERCAVLEAFEVAPESVTRKWPDRKLDESLYALRQRLQEEAPGQPLDFYDPPLRSRWQHDEAELPEADGSEPEVGDADPKDAPINLILYGPPGTGKTYWLQQQLPKYTDQPESVDPETWLQELVAKYGWRPVIAAALADLKVPSRVPLIRDHRWVQAKTKQRGRTPGSVTATIWGYLQEHTPEESSTVKTAIRRQPFVFSKDEVGSWRLRQEWRDVDEEAAELFDQLAAGPAGAKNPVKRYRMVTFHPSFSYEDFVRGIRPVATAEDGTAQFRMVDGVFKQLCDEARANPGKQYALFIDEINRANIAKVFGELITLIELDKRVHYDAEGCGTGGLEVQLPGTEGGDIAEPPFSVPANLDIYGTMNTADRSIALLDLALRRRFDFRELEPQYGELGEVEGVQLGKLLSRLNDRLEFLLDRDHRIGHAYLMRISSLEQLRRAFRLQVIPLLQEYFFDDFGRVAWVLATAKDAPEFIARNELRKDTLFEGLGPSGGGDVRMRYHVTDSASWTAASFRGLYGHSIASAEAAGPA